MDYQGRRHYIANRVVELGEVSFAALAEDLHVSEMTIRRDIETLEAEGILRRVVGGAIALAGTASEPSFESRASKAAKEKEHIANAVVDLLVPGETVILDSGSTVLSVARAIKARGLSLTVITPSVLAAVHLSDAPGITVHLVGGVVRPGELSVVGPETLETFSRFNCDTFVMGVAGVDEAGGVSDYHYDEAHVKQSAAKAAKRVIVAADRQKLGTAALVKIADLEAIDIIVTDAAPSHPTVKAAGKLGVSVVEAIQQTRVI